MPVAHPPPSSPKALSALLANVSRRWQGAPLWAALVALVVTVQAALLWLTWQQEQSKRQEDTETAALAIAADVRQRLVDNAQALQRLVWEQGRPERWRPQAEQVLHERPELMRIERRGPGFSVDEVVTSAAAFPRPPTRAPTSCPTRTAWGWRWSICASRWPRRRAPPTPWWSRSRCPTC
jgi:two-component system sensor histidine kinase DctS